MPNTEVINYLFLPNHVYRDFVRGDWLLDQIQTCLEVWTVGYIHTGVKVELPALENYAMVALRLRIQYQGENRRLSGIIILL